jgi:hypothetical protein
MVESHSKIEIRKCKVEENKMKFAITQIFWHIYKVVIGTYKLSLPNSLLSKNGTQF